jgi:hypothetical protein
MPPPRKLLQARVDKVNDFMEVSVFMTTVAAAVGAVVYLTTMFTKFGVFVLL